jgi:hypothetical protein
VNLGLSVRVTDAFVTSSKELRVAEEATPVGICGALAAKVTLSAQLAMRPVPYLVVGWETTVLVTLR